jgi:hypothetical protein
MPFVVINDWIGFRLRAPQYEQQNTRQIRAHLIAFYFIVFVIPSGCHFLSPQIISGQLFIARIHLFTARLFIKDGKMDVKRGHYRGDQIKY